jgi:hypothetical protein
MFQSLLAYEQLIQTIGGTGCCVTQPSKLQAGLQQAMRTQGTVCVSLCSSIQARLHLTNGTAMARAHGASANCRFAADSVATRSRE